MQNPSGNYLYPAYEITSGTINRFLGDRGYGFICADRLHERVFFHRDQVVPGLNPSAGTRVRFRMGRNDSGLIAENIEKENNSGDSTISVPNNIKTVRGLLDNKRDLENQFKQCFAGHVLHNY